MGVVKDVTVDNLVTAVGNIDTSTLAQDSTLQNVVTAIGNISGGSDPVTNTTVNSLCKDTTGQSIASAISGLGATLGSDRALIDGSNIGNKGAFRDAIGVTPTYNSVKQITVKAGSPYTVTFRHQYKTLFLIGFAQGIGNVILTISSTGSTIDSVKDLINLSSFSNSALTFSAVTDTITISSNNSSLSYFTIVIGNSIIGNV